MVSLFLPLFLPVVFLIDSIHCIPDSDYAYPRFLILGPRGVGKSSLASVLAGCAPNDNSCLPVCTSVNSCTENTSIVEAKFLGHFPGSDLLMNAGNSTITDTPGFGDGNQENPAFISEMIHILEDDLKHVNVIVLCFDGLKWDTGMMNMIEKLEVFFGQKLWENVIIEVTKWSYDAKSIQDRERHGITEEDTLVAINKQLMKKFHLNHSLPGVFLDSFAVYYPDDEVQTRFFRKFSSDLWQAAVDRPPFSFKAIERVQNVKSPSDCGIGIDCCDFLTNEINDMKLSINDLVVTDENLNNRIDHFNERLNDNTMKIVDNQLEISTNKKQIDTNTEDIATNTETTSRQVSYCAFKTNMHSTGTITYSYLVTNINSFETGGLDIGTGVFSPPTQGTYLVTAHFNTMNIGNFQVYLTLNGKHITHGEIYSRSSDDDADSSGKSLTLTLTDIDNLSLDLTRMSGQIIGIVTFCTTLLY